jgi:hypothetical protein
MSLRSILRNRLMPSERLVAWGAAQRPQTTSTQFVALIVGMTPGVGMFLAPAISRSETVVLVLTDQRLFVGPARIHSRGLGSGRWRHATLDQVGVQRLPGRKDHFVLAIDQRLAPITLRVVDREARPAQRLWAALRDMCTHDDVLGPQPPPPDPPKRKRDEVAGDWIV